MCFDTHFIDELVARKVVVMTVLLLCTIFGKMPAAFFVPYIIVCHVLSYGYTKTGRDNVIFLAWLSCVFTRSQRRLTSPHRPMM